MKTPMSHENGSLGRKSTLIGESTKDYGHLDDMINIKDEDVTRVL